MQVWDDAPPFPTIFGAPSREGGRVPETSQKKEVGAHQRNFISVEEEVLSPPDSTKEITGTDRGSF